MSGTHTDKEITELLHLHNKYIEKMAALGKDGNVRMDNTDKAPATGLPEFGEALEHCLLDGFHIGY
jgi:hypothetical protein